MIQEAIYKVTKKENLDFDTAKAVMGEMMDGTATQAQMGSFLTALRMKGETIDEITACATVMREKCDKVKVEGDVMDIVGTGGDEVGTFNISTTSAFVMAAGGIKVAKHGNRSVSSKSGAADVLESLGAKITLTPEQCKEVLDQTGICFMFAQVHHASMKYAGPVRKQIALRTVFNILGPLANPASADVELMGVYKKELVRPLAQVLANLGVKRGLVVCGNDGLDEITLTGDTIACEMRDGVLTDVNIHPEDFGLSTCKLEELIGGNSDENAKITRGILDGSIQGAKREVILLNAGLSFYIYGKTETMKEGVELAKEMIDSGKALEKMNEFIELTNKIA